MERISITTLATYIVAKGEDEKQEAEHGVFDVSQYTHEQQMAMLVMRFNDPLAKAVIMRLHHSTVAGRDFHGLVQWGRPMTEKEHKYWRACWLRHAAKAVQAKDWRGASEAYGAAAHHAAVLSAIKDSKRSLKPEM